MSRAMLTERNKNQRQRVLDKAAELFAKNGFHETTVEDIAKALNLTKGSVYYYIPSKQDILYQLHSQAHQRLLDRVTAAIQANDSPHVLLRKIITSQIELNLSENGRAAILVILRTWPSLTGRVRAKIVKLRDKHEALVRQTIQDGVDQGLFIDCDTALAGFAVLAAVNYIPQWYNPEGRFGKEEIATFYADLLLRGLTHGQGRDRVNGAEAIPGLASEAIAAFPIDDLAARPIPSAASVSQR